MDRINKNLLTIIVLLLLPLQATAQNKMKTANVQHGQSTDGSFHYDTQATTLAAGATDIVAIQEASNGADLTHWDTAFTASGMTRAVYVEHPALAEGCPIYYRNSTVTLLDTYSHQLSNVANPTSGSTTTGWAGTSDIRRTVTAIKATIGGQTAYFVNVHLCPSACADSSGSQFSVQRVSQAEDLRDWINSTLTGAPVFILGDLNFARNYPKSPSGLQLDTFTNDGYTDLWAAGISASVATANWEDRNEDGQPDMPLGVSTTRTADSRGIDYMLAKGAGITLNSIDVPDGRATCPHALVAGGTFPSCSPEVTGGPGVSGFQWDIPEDFGVRLSDHNWITASVTLASGSGGSKRKGKLASRGKAILK